MVWLKKRLFLAGFALTTWCASANAAPFTFDFNGTAGAGPGPTNAIGFDWAPGSLFSDQSIPVAVGNTFNAYYQARLQAVQTAGPSAPPGSQFPPIGREVTIVATINEQVSSVVGNTANFDVLGGSYSIYAGAADSNDTTGFGFNNGDLIMSGTFTNAGINNFTATANVVPFDLTGSGNYPDTDSLFGTGAFSVNATVDFFDPNYFIIGNQQFVGSLFGGNNDSQFDVVFPALTFFNGLSPNIGAINAFSGPDALFEVDSNQSFTLEPLPPPPPPIPEPASIAAFAAALGAGAVGLRRKMKAQIA